MSYQSRQLVRPNEGRVLAGVCAGIARYFGIDPLIVRIALVLFGFFIGSGILVYVLGWALMPDQNGKRAALPIMIAGIILSFSAFCYLLSLIFS